MTTKNGCFACCRRGVIVMVRRCVTLHPTVRLKEKNSCKPSSKVLKAIWTFLDCTTILSEQRQALEILHGLSLVHPPTKERILTMRNKAGRNLIDVRIMLPLFDCRSLKHRHADPTRSYPPFRPADRSFRNPRSGHS